MKLRLLSVFFLLWCNISLSQPDTLIYQRQTANLSDQASKQNYLDTLLKRDQQFRGNDAITLFDLENLISISYYINQYGFPSSEVFGEASDAPRLIWIHNTYHSLRKLSFPLVLGAFQSGQFTERKLRDYYLKTLYAESYDDDRINEIPLPELFELLDLNTSNSISIEALIYSMEEKRKFNSQPKKEVKFWKGAEKSKWITANGERKLMSYKTSPVEIITFESCKIYFHKINADNSHEPQELQKIGEGKFRFKDRQSDKYFEIDPDGNLLYRTEAEVIDFHLKQE